MMSHLIQNYQTVLQAIRTHEHAGNRAPHAVQLIAVSKTFPSTDIRTLYHAGQRDFGENYIQEWQQKAADLHDCPELVWHVIGHVQNNKSRAVAEQAHWLHTLDSEKLARRLHQQRPPDRTPLNVLIQINISADAHKHGIEPNQLSVLAQQILALPRLQLRGLMCVAEHASPHVVRKQFQAMQYWLTQLQTLAPQADTLSMGMSGDMATAIECGTTMVRVGSAIFGQRNHFQAA